MIQFSEIQQPTPNLEDVTSARTELLNQIESSSSVEDVCLAMQQWDQGRREIGTWEALVQLRFCQDTTDEQAKQAQDEMDQLQPKLTELDINIKRALVTIRYDRRLNRKLENSYSPYGKPKSQRSTLSLLTT